MGGFQQSSVSSTAYCWATVTFVLIWYIRTVPQFFVLPFPGGKTGYVIDGRRYMRKSRFTDEQILAILERAEVERNIRSVCQANGISEQTFYRWKAKYRTARLQGDRRLRSLEDENRRLRELVVEQSLDIQALRAALERGGSEAQPDEP